MKTYTNRNRWAGGFVPPYAQLRSLFLMGFLFAFAHHASAQSTVNASLPTMQFKAGTAELTDAAQISTKVTEILRQFHVVEPIVEDSLREADNYVVFVKIRTDRNEVAPEGVDLRLARAEVIRKLFLKTTSSQLDPKLDRDELRIHSALAYNGGPAGVWFEIQLHDQLIARIEISDSLLTQLTRR